MRILLSDEYSIIDDNGLSYALCKIVPTTEKEKERSGQDFKDVRLTYHMTVAQAAHAFVRLQARERIKGDMSFSEYVDKLEEIELEVANILSRGGKA